MGQGSSGARIGDNSYTFSAVCLWWQKQYREREQWEGNVPQGEGGGELFVI